ncbi:MAG: hypothetical protein GY723_12020 [bacterium]|nr:hypothetical protein [bacterium]MCP5069156.1 hypothetical protein [bacterium]
MNTPIRILVALPGVVMLMNALGWLIRPGPTAESLAMPLLEGMARSTQIGDLGAFFAVTGIVILLGAWLQQRSWLYCGAMLLGGAAAFRTLAWAFHDAELATTFIASEIVMTAIVLFGASRANTEV